jgi:prevent-host-death family protein
VKTVNVHEAKTHLSRLLAEVESGETVTIARAGEPVAQLVSVTRSTGRRRLGTLAGVFTVPEDFDRMDEAAVADLFEGRE